MLAKQTAVSEMVSSYFSIFGKSSITILSLSFEMVEKLYESSDDSRSFSSLVGDRHFYFSSTQVINGGEFVDSNSTEC